MNEGFVSILRLSIAAGGGVLLLTSVLKLLKGKVKWQWQYQLWMIVLLTFIMPIWLTIPLSIQAPERMLEEVSTFTQEEKRLPKGEKAQSQKEILQEEVDKAKEVDAIPLQAAQMPTKVTEKTVEYVEEKSIRQSIILKKLLTIEGIWIVGIFLCGIYRLVCYRRFKKEIMASCYLVEDERALRVYRRLAYKFNKNEGLVTSMANSKEKLKDRCMQIQKPIQKRRVYQFVSIGLGVVLLVTTSFLSGCYVVEQEPVNKVMAVVNTELPKEETPQVQKAFAEELVISEDGKKVIIREEGGERTLFHYQDEDKDAKITQAIMSGGKNARDKYYVYIQVTTQGLEKVYVVDKDTPETVRGSAYTWLAADRTIINELSYRVVESVFGIDHIPQELTHIGMTKVENIQWMTSGPTLVFDFSIHLGDTIGELKGSANYTLDTDTLIINYKEATHEEALINTVRKTLNLTLTSEEQKNYDALRDHFTVELAQTLTRQDVLKIWINAIIDNDKELYQALSVRSAYAYHYPLKLDRTIGILHRMNMIINEDTPYTVYSKDSGGFQIGPNMHFGMRKNEEGYWTASTMGPIN